MQLLFVSKGWIYIFESGGVRTEPVINPKVWEEIPDEHIAESICFAKGGQHADGNSKTSVAEENEFGILGFV